MKSQIRAYDFTVTALTTSPAVMQIVCNHYAKEIIMRLNDSVIKNLKLPTNLTMFSETTVLAEPGDQGARCFLLVAIGSS